ncbi:MAG TPA: hypothetical protein PK542_13340 [Treponemataceae bacterium]|nr:hypothetical protein [Treponemataceae bacterium]HPS45461.1 hypothetical protein [Treponemataceae bacterium]
MKETLLRQYDHAWKMFYLMVNDFDEDSWLTTGCSYIVPARIAYHILGGVNYYSENEAPVALPSGKENTWNWELSPIEDLPTKEDIIGLIHAFKPRVDSWINACDFEAENKKFPWTGANAMSVALFLLRHMEYHIGELNLLLHMGKGGDANDNWVKAFGDVRI